MTSDAFNFACRACRLMLGAIGPRKPAATVGFTGGLRAVDRPSYCVTARFLADLIALLLVTANPHSPLSSFWYGHGVDEFSLRNPKGFKAGADGRRNVFGSSRSDIIGVCKAFPTPFTCEKIYSSVMKLLGHAPCLRAPNNVFCVSHWMNALSNLLHTVFRDAWKEVSQYLSCVNPHRHQTNS